MSQVTFQTGTQQSGIHIKMLRLCSTAYKKLTKIVRNPTGLDIYQMIVGFEALAGLRPYKILYLQDTQKLRLKWSRFGCLMTLFHLLIFCMCCVVVMVYKTPVMYISDDTISRTEATIMSLLHLINMFVIFIQVLLLIHT